jgi:hypothetical protein
MTNEEKLSMEIYNYCDMRFTVLAPGCLKLVKPAGISKIYVYQAYQK